MKLVDDDGLTAGPTQHAHQRVNFDDLCIAAEDLENFHFAMRSLMHDKFESREMRAAESLLGAMEPHLQTLRLFCSQESETSPAGH